ncbi:MAG: hypothetical protein ACOY15_10945 [Pseudomonadota bacterium]
MKKLVLMFGVLAFSSFNAAAATDFLAIKTLRCKFDETFFTSTYGEKGGQVKTEKNSDIMEIVFDSINRTSGKARLIGNAGAEDVTISGTNGVLHIVEITPSGNMNLVTVYNHPMPNDGLFAINSRHVGNAQFPMVSHMIGNCTPLQ